MKLEKILSEHINKSKPKYTRELGRYWATDINSIKKGYLTPDNFFVSKDINIDGVRMILTGMAYEDMLTKIFKEGGVDCSPQEKKVMKITEEIDLVVKPDYVFPDFVVETKYPFSVMKPNSIPDRYKYQLECEYRAFERPVYLGTFSAPFNVTFTLYHPSKNIWKNIQKTLVDFHEQLKKKQNEI